MAFAGPSSSTQAAMRRVRGRLEVAADFDAYDDPVATTSYGVAGPFRPRGGAGAGAGAGGAPRSTGGRGAAQARRPRRGAGGGTPGAAGAGSALHTPNEGWMDALAPALKLQVQLVTRRLRESTMALAEADAEKTALERRVREAERTLEGLKANDAKVVGNAEAVVKKLRQRCIRLETLLEAAVRERDGCLRDRGELRRALDAAAADNARLRADLDRTRALGGGGGGGLPASPASFFGATPAAAAPGAGGLSPSLREQAARLDAQNVQTEVARMQTLHAAEVQGLKQLVLQREGEIQRLGGLLRHPDMAPAGGAAGAAAATPSFLQTAAGAPRPKTEWASRDLEETQQDNAQLQILLAERDSKAATLKAEVESLREFLDRASKDRERFREHLTGLTTALIPVRWLLGPPEAPGAFASRKDLQKLLATFEEAREAAAFGAKAVEQYEREREGHEAAVVEAKAAARAAEARAEALQREGEERAEKLEAAYGGHLEALEGRFRGAEAEARDRDREVRRLAGKVLDLEAANGRLREALAHAEVEKGGMRVDLEQQSRVLAEASAARDDLRKRHDYLLARPKPAADRADRAEGEKRAAEKEERAAGKEERAKMAGGGLPRALDALEAGTPGAGAGGLMELLLQVQSMHVALDNASPAVGGA